MKSILSRYNEEDDGIFASVDQTDLEDHHLFLKEEGS